MNKFLTLVVAFIVIVGAIFFLRGNTINQTTSIPAISTTPSATGTATPSGQQTATEAAVTLTVTGFNPQAITVKVGTKVVWTNKSGQSATVNSDPHPIHTAYPPLNLGGFDDGGTVSLVFDKAGTYGYHNHLDASQKGTVVVTP